MKILVVSNMYPDTKHPSYGIFVKNFCKQLKYIGKDYELSVMHKADKKSQKIIKYIIFYIKTFLKCIFEKNDLIYIHYASHSAAPVLAARKVKKCKIYTNVHGSDVVPENKKQEKLQKYTIALLNISSKVIVPSEYFKNLVCEKYDISEKKVYIFPSAGIDAGKFFPMEQDKIDVEKYKYHINPQKITFGMAGRISSKKGWDTFLEAINITILNGYEANFIIVGDGDESDKLEDKLLYLGLEKKVIFIKKLLAQDELAKFYSMLDWFVFPTKREGESLGLVAIEAMACKTPVIASDFAAPKFYVENGVNGYKYECGNTMALAALMTSLIKKEVDETILKEGAYKTAKKFWTDNIISKLELIFNEDY